ncbi:hypothetical protein [Hamadaea tsunoensis]|uniref:hypothetical protein n=1 Tax=Hamadaea tsunoensis TaxID=53368 RepID=UPI00041452A2|nr:hypothetical protein [Hamadaea tsunoensis]
MPSQSGAGQRLRSAPPIAFEPEEWDLLTRLPAKVMIAATSAEPDSDQRTVAEGLAGIDAIAAGAVSDSDLVRAVVAAIYAELDPDPPTAEQFRDRHAGITEVLVTCRAASLTLTRRADPADAAAYGQWLQNIAARVCGASRTGGVFGLGGSLISDAEHTFLVDLDRALRP